VRSQRTGGAPAVSERRTGELRDHVHDSVAVRNERARRAASD